MRSFSHGVVLDWKGSVRIPREGYPYEESRYVRLFMNMYRYRAGQGSNETHCTGHEMSAGTARRYRAGQGSNDYLRTGHALPAGAACLGLPEVFDALAEDPDVFFAPVVVIENNRWDFFDIFHCSTEWFQNRFEIFSLCIIKNLWIINITN